MGRRDINEKHRPGMSIQSSMYLCRFDVYRNLGMCDRSIQIHVHRERVRVLGV